MAEILVATDGSEGAARALAVAIELAREIRDRIVVVAVWQIPTVDFGFGGYIAAEVFDELRANAEETVARAADEARRAGVEAETVVLEGAPAMEICRLARERGSRLIVVGSHGWSAVMRLMMGSVSSGVVHHAPCPVLVVPSERPEHEPG